MYNALEIIIQNVKKNGGRCESKEQGAHKHLGLPVPASQIGVQAGGITILEAIEVEIPLIFIKNSSEPQLPSAVILL